MTRFAGLRLAILLLCGMCGGLVGVGLPVWQTCAAEAATAGAGGGRVSAGDVPGRLDILEQWRGEGSGYRERPSFFLIRSLPELQVFWEKHEPGEPVPNVNFGTRMLFVWVPGPGLCGYRVMRAAGMTRQKKVWRLELEVERSDSLGAGRWRTPWLMALLPRVDGDVEVVRIGDAVRGEARFMPLAMIWDMQRERQQPATGELSSAAKAGDGAASGGTEWGENPFGEGPKLPQGRNVSEEIVVKHDPNVAANARAEARATAARSAAPSGGTASGSSAPAAVITPAPAAGDGVGPTATEAKEPAAKTASAEVDPFGDAFNLDF